ncbi:MAG: 30S ribosome-binding factor RbfA [Gemmatimonadota bacterium]|nr:30S ribosome-binding factor RbfA [Gemmatimonadota bacterium]
MPHRYRRTDRVDELLKEEIAVILRDVKDPRVGFVTVMDVEVSPDLRHARVFVSVLGEEKEKLETIEALDRASGFVRARLGEAVTLKYLPNLHFVLDRTLEKATRIEQLIDEMRADVEDGDEDEPGSGPERSDGDPDDPPAG